MFFVFWNDNCWPKDNMTAHEMQGVQSRCTTRQAGAHQCFIAIPVIPGCQNVNTRGECSLLVYTQSTEGRNHLQTQARVRKPQVGHYYTSFSVVSVFAVAVWVEITIIVDKSRRNRVPWWALPAANYISASLSISRLPNGMRVSVVCPGGIRVPSGCRVGKSNDLCNSLTAYCSVL